MSNRSTRYLQEDTARRIKELIAQGLTNRIIAERMGFDIKHVQRIRSGKIWKEIEVIEIKEQAR
jgi:hypothetical protein